MGNPVVALIFGIILIMSLCPILLVQLRLRHNYIEFISEVLISYWRYIWLDTTEFIRLVQLVIFNCVVFCLFVLNVILFFSERIINSDWYYQFGIFFIFLFGNFCFKIWHFLNGCNGNKESIIVRIIRKRCIAIGNLARGVKDR